MVCQGFALRNYPDGGRGVRVTKRPRPALVTVLHSELPVLQPLIYSLGLPGVRVTNCPGGEKGVRVTKRPSLSMRTVLI